ncbi:MAG: thioredoxin family protein [Sulfurisoma sp.]|nr:thioredoxin family protein [Sulfurisoma sp.]
MTAPAVPDALLLLSSSCPHCPAMLQVLADLLKAGKLGRLEVVNVAAHPEVAETLGVRSVPWVRIGAFELAGLRGREELEGWVQRAATGEGMADYFHTLLKDGELARVRAMIEARPELLAALLPIVADPEASINVRIGASVIFEGQAGGVALRALLPQLAELAEHGDARVRADACFYLGLGRTVAARPALEACLVDQDAEVREIAAEALSGLG